MKKISSILRAYTCTCIFVLISLYFDIRYVISYIIYISISPSMDFPGGSMVKTSASIRDSGDAVSIPESGKSSEEEMAAHFHILA